MNTDLSNNISSDEEEVNAAKKKRVHFTEFQLSGLNHAYGRDKGPSDGTANGKVGREL